MATKEEKQRKQFAEKLLRIKGVDYDEWLDEKHRTVIQENQDLVMMALEVVLDTGSSQDSTTKNKNSIKTSETDSIISKPTVSNDNKNESTTLVEQKV